MRYTLALLITLLSTLTVLAQASSSKLDLFFEESSIASVDVDQVLNSRKSNSNTFYLQVPIEGQVLDLKLTERNIYGPEYHVNEATADGIVVRKNHQRPIATTGAVLGDLGSSAAITINDGFIYGRITTSANVYYIEPAKYYDSKSRDDQFVVYDVTKVKQDAPATCGVTEAMRQTEQVKKYNVETKSMMSCFEVEWAIAHDFGMFQSYGSVSATENHAIGVANDVQTNYDDEFADELQLIVTELFVPTTSGQDPFPSTSNASTLLDDFSSWASSGFQTHDIGSLWTSRDISFNGSFSTIGLAFVGVVCTGSRYNVLEDFSSNASLKRVLVAHELGHNFDAIHDNGGGFIMSPSVNSSTTWSNNSIFDIENHYLSRSCLSTCSGGGGGTPPVPDFDITYLQQCASVASGINAEIEFVDASDNSPTSWEWSFEGGNPSTSTDQVPFVTYDVPGLYNVTLTVANASGTVTEVFDDAVEILEQPVAEFLPTVVGPTVSFENLTIGGLDYNWSFGDGSFSTEFQPTHTYMADGTYNVTLIAFNDICEDIFSEDVVVVSPPTAAFTSNDTSGCVSFDVSFDASSSTNTTTYQWAFQGGSPATSTEPDPVVTYASAGQYDVELIVTNATGLQDTIIKTDYITVEDVPSVGIAVSTNGLVADCEYTGSGASSVSWDFGDGSTATGPVQNHVYGMPGDYVIEMTATNVCGSTQELDTVDIEIPPSASFDSDFQPNDVLCQGFTASFTANEQNNIDTYSWIFEGGVPATSTVPNPSVMYADAGTFDVTLVVTNGLGTDSITVTDLVVIAAPPTAAFDQTTSQLTVDFDNNSADALNYEWDFGDGSTSVEDNPSHTYAMPGVYTVVLTASNPCAVDTFSQMISVQAQPIADFTSNVTQGCVDLQVDYMQTATGDATSFAWTFEGGSPAASTAGAPTVTYTSAGSYDVQLIAVNAAGADTLTWIDYITVEDVPVAAVTAQVDSNVITLVDEAIDADTALYTVNGQSHAGPTFLAPDNGEYMIQQIASNMCGSDTATATVEVTAYPEVTIDGPVTLSGCSPLTQSYAAVATNSTSYQWAVTGASLNTTSDQNTVVTFDSSGVYELSVTASSSLGSATAVQMVAVDIVDSPAGTFSNSANAATVTFVADDVDADTYTWDFGDGATGTGQTVAHTYSASGDYQVELTVQGECGQASSSQILSIEVNTSVVDFDADMVQGCVPVQINFMDFSSNDPQSWLWTFEGGTPSTSTEQNPVVQYSTPGTYDVTLVVQNAFGQSTGTKVDYIVIEDVPVAEGEVVTSGPAVDLVSSSLGATSTQWIMGNGDVVAGVDTSYTYRQDGRYEVLLVVENACGTDTTAFQVDILGTDTDESSVDLKLEVYPNPTAGQIFVYTAQGSLVHLYDLQGQKVSASIVNLEPGVYGVNLGDLASGVYLVRVEHETSIAYEKIVKM